MKLAGPEQARAAKRVHLAADERWKGRRGYSLLECLVYLAVLALIMDLAFAAYYRMGTNHRRLQRNAEDILRAVQAGERWREDIRSAVRPLVPSAAESGLRIPQAKGEVAYAFREGAVWRRESAAGPWREFLGGVKRSDMSPDPRTQVTAWRWELELQTTQRVVRVPPLFTFLSAPRSRAPQTVEKR